MAVILLAGFMVVGGVNAQRATYDIQTGQTPGYNNPFNVQELNESYAVNTAASRQRRLNVLRQLLTALQTLRDLRAKLPATSLPATPPVGQDTFSQRDQLTIGDRVEVSTGLGLQRLNIRHTPSTLAALLGQQPTGAQGSITDGPRTSGNITWWYVNFDRDPSGWVAVAYLKKAPALKPIPTPIPTPSPSLGVPMIANISPVSGPIGTRVTITGNNFIAGTNSVRFGAGYIHNLTSVDGTTISFDLVDNLNNCQITTGACTNVFIQLTPGPYQVAVVNAGGTSNSFTFTVTDNSTPTDITTPSAPSNLSATAVSSSQVDLSWNASSDNVGVTGYRVYRNDDLITTVTNNSYSNTGLTPNTSYGYYVRAIDAAGNVSGPSTLASVTTQGNTTPTPVEKSITITSPLAGQVLTAGDSNNKITWTSTGFSQVKIELCLANNNLACRLLAFGAPASGSWNLPATHVFYPGELEVVVSSMSTNIFAPSEIIKRSGVFTMTSPSAALPSDYSGQLASALAVLQSLIAGVVASIE